ncbi:hypothetical protein HAX54_043278 [Datura stramonium]|uniref:Glycosyltransferase N-terminal domain-containing protein n=1 Tax=Datura stramonium TaxID=4076 RepID=A0ABS8W0R9_DATST|nr:hypothetical protein [Datura stramonium]
MARKACTQCDKNFGFLHKRKTGSHEMTWTGLKCLIANYNHQARVRVNALNPSDVARIHFHDLPSTDFALGKIPRIWDACMLLRKPIASFLRDISSKARRVVVVHDYSNVL